VTELLNSSCGFAFDEWKWFHRKMHADFRDSRGANYITRLFQISIDVTCFGEIILWIGGIGAATSSLFPTPYLLTA